MHRVCKYLLSWEPSSKEILAQNWWTLLRLAIAKAILLTLTFKYRSNSKSKFLVTYVKGTSVHRKKVLWLIVYGADLEFRQTNVHKSSEFYTSLDLSILIFSQEITLSKLKYLAWNFSYWNFLLWISCFSKFPFIEDKTVLLLKAGKRTRNIIVETAVNIALKDMEFFLKINGKDKVTSNIG